MESRTDRLDSELFFLGQPLLPDKPGKTAGPVTALTGLTAVRVVNAHEKIGTMRIGLRHN